MSTTLNVTHDEATTVLTARWSDDDGTSFQPLLIAVVGRADKLKTCRKWLLDLRYSASPSASDQDWFYRSFLPQVAYEKPNAGLLRVALYITPLLQGLAPQLPVESFQNQHGFRVAMFTDEAEAHRWLSGITASK